MQWLPPEPHADPALSLAVLNSGASPMIRFCAIWMNSGFSSIPMNERPCRRATTPVVPLPQNGSITTAGTCSESCTTRSHGAPVWAQTILDELEQLRTSEAEVTLFTEEDPDEGVPVRFLTLEDSLQYDPFAPAENLAQQERRRVANLQLLEIIR